MKNPVLSDMELNEKEIYTHLFEGISRAGFVSTKAKRLIRAKAKIVQFEKNEIVLEKGKICRYCYFLVSGLMRAYFEKGIKDVTAWFMTGGDVAIGVTSFYTQKPSKEFIVAMEPTICVRLSYEDLELIYKECVDFNVVGRRLTEKYHMLFTVRLSTIVDSPEEKYLTFLEEYPDLIGRVKSLDHIATYLGFSRETLTRVRRDLAKRVK